MDQQWSNQQNDDTRWYENPLLRLQLNFSFLRAEREKEKEEGKPFISNFRCSSELSKKKFFCPSSCLSSFETFLSKSTKTHHTTTQFFTKLFFFFVFPFFDFFRFVPTLLMEEGEEETSPNIGDTVEITDDGEIYSTLNECGIDSAYWEGIPLEWMMLGGERWIYEEGIETKKIDPPFGWKAHNFVPREGMKGTVVHVWCRYFPAEGWDQENIAKVLMEVVREDQKIFYVPIGEGGIKVSQILFFFSRREEKRRQKEKKKRRKRNRYLKSTSRSLNQQQRSNQQNGESYHYQRKENENNSLGKIRLAIIIEPRD